MKKSAPTDPEKNLERAANHLYATFRTYRGDPNWNDPLAMPDAERDAAIAEWPVRDLDPRYFYYFGWKAVSMHDAGTPALKYFFPRVLHEATLHLELEPIQQGGPLDLAMYIHDMNKHNWNQWPDNERHAIIAFFETWFESCISRPIGPLADPALAYCPERSADELLAYASFLNLDVGPLLATWAGDESFAATSQIVGMLRTHGEFISTHAALGGWGELWGESGASIEAIQKVVRFLTSARTCSRLERAFFAATETKSQQVLATAVDSLRNTYQIWNTTLTGTGHIPKWAEEVAAEKHAL